MCAGKDHLLCVGPFIIARRYSYQASHLRDLGLLQRKDGQLAPVIFEGDWCFVTKNARDFRGPDSAKGSSGEYAGVDLHAGLVCIHGPPEGFTKAEQLEAFAVALDLIEQYGGDPTNLLVEVVWTADGIGYEVAEFPTDKNME
jgi:hypothetical protein